ncbi:MAG: hypothetical protein M0C28_20260 [Candidatus Moduliflexus flocculans]|nr:hypothetical protein [Candidatus Moduliflexus flocculans]
MDRARPRRHEGAQLRLHPGPLAAGPPGPRLLRPPWHPHPGRGADLGRRTPSPSPAPSEIERIKANGLEQLREMIARDRNHPCVFSWGLCNEVDGQNPVAQEFVRRMLREAKGLDPGRLCSYASNSLQTTPERDVAGEMDFIEWNEYYESWFGGDVGTLQREPRGHPPRLPRQARRHLGIRLLRLHRRPARGRRPPRRDPPDPQRGLPPSFPGWPGSSSSTTTTTGPTSATRERAFSSRGSTASSTSSASGNPSFEALREESSPVEAVTVGTDGAVRTAVVRTRQDRPGLHAERATRSAGRPTGTARSRSRGASRLFPISLRARRPRSASPRARRTFAPSASRSSGRRASPSRPCASDRTGAWPRIRPSARSAGRSARPAAPPCTGCRGRSGPRGPAPWPSSA